MKKVKGLRWWIIGLVALATVINYVDRSSIAIMWPDINKDIGLGKDQYALIMSMFMIAYAISQSLSGKLYDWVGTRIGFVISIVIWSISAAFHCFARGLASFSFFRFMLGLGEAGNWPGATKSNAEWFPIKERAFAQGIFNSGAALGSVISPPLIAGLYLLMGWKLTFVILGLLGLLWLIPWLFINRALPDQHPWITDQEKEYILTGQQTEDVKKAGGDKKTPGWGEILTYKQSWSVIVSRFILDPIWWLFVIWLPIYLNERFGFDIKQIGLSAWVPYVGAAVGSLFGGWLAGYLIGKGWTADKARKWTITLGGIFMLPCLILTAYASSPITAILLIAVILFGFQITMNNIQTLPSDFYSGKAVGSLAGMGGTSAAIGVIIVTNLVPILSKINYTPVFLLGAMLVPLSIISVFIFGGHIQRVILRSK